MEGFLRIGEAIRPYGSKPAFLDIPLDALTRHVCIVGTTGSGKSTTAAVLALELAEKKIPSLIFDRTGEYARLLGSCQGFKVYRPAENLTVAPLQVVSEKPIPLQVEGWVSVLGHYTIASFGSPLSPLQGRVLREVLLTYYKGTTETLTISRLVSKLERYEDSVRRRGGWEESIEALISRLVPLTVDIVGKTLDRPYNDFKIDSVLAGPLIIDLSVLGEDGAKNLLTQVLLKQVYDMFRGSEMTAEVKVVVMIDEAQHLAPNEQYLSIPEKCAIELRKYGFSLVMIATRPSLISQNVMANSSTVISHQLTNERDIRTVSGHFLGGTDNPSNQERLRGLSVGCALAQLNYPAPKESYAYLMGLPIHRAKLGLVSGEKFLPKEFLRAPLSGESRPGLPRSVGR